MHFVKKPRKKRPGLAGITILLMLAMVSPGMDMLGQDPYVEWISQFPEKQGKPLKKKFKDEFVEVFTGTNPAAFVVKPMAVVASSPDSIWILDQGAGSIFRIAGGVGEMPHIKNKPAVSLKSLVGLCPYKGGKLLFTDSFLNQVFILSEHGRRMTVLNEHLTLEQPTGIAYCPLTKEIWISETKAHRITVIDESGNLIKQMGHHGNAPGEFNYPTSIWIDESGTVFIVDAMNFRIQIFSKEGEFCSVFGEIGDASGDFARPKGIATDSYGNIYISDALFHTVQIFDRQGNYLYHFGVQGQGPGEFWMPSGIFIDKEDYIYVADTYNSRIQIFKLISGQ